MVHNSARKRRPSLIVENIRGNQITRDFNRPLPIRAQNVRTERRLETNTKLRPADQIQRAFDHPMRVPTVHRESRIQSTHEWNKTQGEKSKQTSQSGMPICFIFSSSDIFNRMPLQ